MSTANIGKVVQCIGAVVDVEFPRDQMPKVFEALIIDDASSQAEAGLTLEVQQQLGDGIVRTIAMGSSDGLARGTAFKSTGAQIQVPVGTGTLGRIMDVLGRQSMRLVLLILTSAVLFTKKHLALKSYLHLLTC